MYGSYIVSDNKNPENSVTKNQNLWFKMVQFGVKGGLLVLSDVQVLEVLLKVVSSAHHPPPAGGTDLRQDGSDKT